MRRTVAVLALASVCLLGACGGGAEHASKATASVACGDHNHPAEVARLLHQPFTAQFRQTYFAACGWYNYGCGRTASGEVLDPRTGKALAPGTIATAPVCDYTRVFHGRGAPAKLVKFGAQCYLQAPHIPEIPAPCVPPNTP